MSNVLGFAFGLIMMLVVYVIVSLLLIKLGWSLFLVPVFGLRELAWTEALGFGLLAGAFRSGGSFKTKE